MNFKLVNIFIICIIFTFYCFFFISQFFFSENIDLSSCGHQIHKNIEILKKLEAISSSTVVWKII